MKPLRTVLFCIAQLLWLACAHAAMLPETGQIVARHIVLFGKSLPLPSGDWRVAAASFGRVMGEDPGPYGAIGTVLLTPTADRSDLAFVLLRTNALPVRGGWGPPTECSGDAALWWSTSEPRDLHNACTFVVTARAGRVAAWSGTPAVAAQLPPWVLVAGFRASDRNDMVEARYGIVPPKHFDRSEFSGNPSSLDPAQRVLLDSLRNWAHQARQSSLAALRDTADQVPAIPDLLLATHAPANSVVEEITSLRLALYKLATYRAPVTLANWALASVLAGDVWVGASVAIWQSVTHSALYFGNEMAWEWPQTAPPMDVVPTATTGGVEPSTERRSGSGGFVLDGKQVPLPTGTWTILAEHVGPTTSAVMLGQLEGRVLRGLAAIHTNRAGTTDIFGAAGDCSRQDVYFATIRFDTPLDGYCSYAKPVVPDDTAGGDALWAKARVRLAGVDVPTALLVVGARARTRENFVDVRYYFPLDLALAQEQLSAHRVAVTPPLLERVVALQTWADLVQIPLELGVRGRMPGEMGQVPRPWPIATVNDALRRQADAPLEQLHALGAIDAAALQQQLALTDAALEERERQRWSLWMRSAYKVATYRVLSYVDAVAVSWIITASPEQSLAYATINAVAQPIMAYVNEIGWAGSGVGRAAASLQPVDFPEIGTDRP